MDALKKLLEHVEEIAYRKHCGVFSIHHSQTGWEVCMGSIHAEDTRCYPGDTMEEALQAAASAEKGR